MMAVSYPDRVRSGSRLLTWRKAAVLIAGCCICLLFQDGCQQAVSSNTAATVNGRPISYSQLDHAIAAQFSNSPLKANPDQYTQLRLETLRALIDNEILLQRAEKAGLLASDADVDAKFN